MCNLSLNPKDILYHATVRKVYGVHVERIGEKKSYHNEIIRNKI